MGHRPQNDFCHIISCCCCYFSAVHSQLTLMVIKVLQLIDVTVFRYGHGLTTRPLNGSCILKHALKNIRYNVHVADFFLFLDHMVYQSLTMYLALLVRRSRSTNIWYTGCRVDSNDMIKRILRWHCDKHMRATCFSNYVTAPNCRSVWVKATEAPKYDNHYGQYKTNS